MTTLRFKHRPDSDPLPAIGAKEQNRLSKYGLDAHLVREG